MSDAVRNLGPNGRTRQLSTESTKDGNSGLKSCPTTSSASVFSFSGALTASSGTSCGFPRVSLRSILMNGPFSRRTKTRKLRTSPPSRSRHSSIFSDDSALTHGKAGSSIKRHTLTSKSSLSSSKRGSITSKATLGGGPCPSEVTNCNSVINAETSLLNESSSSVAQKVSLASLGAPRECRLCCQNVSHELFPKLISCGHSACLPCLKQYLTVEITESRINISCPQCSELMHPNDIHSIIDSELLSYKFEDFMLRRVLSMDTDTRWCPAPDCGYAVIASGCAGCPKLKCERPGCGTYFCYHCKAEWHPNQTCDMARAQRSPNILTSANCLEDMQNNDDVKPCPRCQALIMKMDDGSCNHMTCSVCGAEFCWLCMKEISDLHYLSPSGCTFWGKKPWSRKKKILWQLGTLIGAPLGIGLVAALAAPAMIIGIPIWVGRKLHARYALSNRHRRNLAMIGGITLSALVSPFLAALAVGLGVPILLAYIYGVVPISLCRSGGCGVTTSASGVRIAFDDDSGMVFGLPGRQSEQGQTGVGTASIGEMSCGASLSADSAAHVLAESDRESASNTAIPPASLTGSIASSCFSRVHRLEIHVDVAQNSRALGTTGETASLAISEHSYNTIDTENASVHALAGSLLRYKVNETECESVVCSSPGIQANDSASGVVDVTSGLGTSNAASVCVHSIYPSASETNSGVLSSDICHEHGSMDMHLDSVSAIINARQFSKTSIKGVTFDSSCDHISISVEEDDVLPSSFRAHTLGQGEDVVILSRHHEDLEMPQPESKKGDLEFFLNVPSDSISLPLVHGRLSPDRKSGDLNAWHYPRSASVPKLES